MNGAPKDERLVRFSVFELDLDSGELFREGRKLKLQGQPFELLVALLERPGAVLTREELRQRVWPSDTAGDFDHGLNRAINKVREALGDSADSPRFIETLPRRGYRFIGPIQQERTVESPSSEIAPLPPAPETHPATPKSALRPALWTGIAAAIVVACFGVWFALWRASPVGPIQVQQLTTNSAENPVWQAVISPDGKYIAYGDSSGIKIRLISTGESHFLPKPASLSAGATWLPAAWFPDGTRIIASSEGKLTSAWTVSAIGATATRLRDNARVYSVSPDGLLIAFTTGKELLSLHNRPIMMNSEIWVMGPRGENARRVIGGGDGTYFGSVQWSPDGKRIAYRKLRFADETLPEYNIESCDLNGGTRSLILSTRQSYWFSGQSDLGLADNFSWTPDGRIIYAVHEPPPNRWDRNLWEIAVNPKTGKARSSPHRITNLNGFRMDGLSITADGRRMVFGSGSDQAQIYVRRILPGWDLDAPRRLTFDETYNSPFDWTPDSKAVIFRSNRTGTYCIYKQALDQNEAELIPTGPESIGLPRVSPDGEWLVYSVQSNVKFPNQSGSEHFLRVPVSGGAPQPLFETKADTVNFDCPRRPEAPCVLCESRADKNEFAFRTFNAANGSGHRLFELAMPVEKPLNFTVSPDGLHLAMVGGDEQGRIEIRSLAGTVERAIHVKEWPNPLTIDWAADGKSVFISHFGLSDSPSGPIGATVLRVDFQGHVQTIWETRGGRFTYAIASPDGKYLAIRDPISERNAWIIENF
jgi:DNA-binding winged helix-turn-helix (wHTH) protein/Tol biopolymer transport system component